MKTLPIATRLLLLFAVSAFAAAVIFAVGVYSSNRLADVGAAEAQQVMLAGERAKIKVATDSMAQALSKALAAIPGEDAKVAHMREAIKDAFFEADRSGYYYIYTGTTNVAHPVNPALHGKDLVDLKGPDGVYSVRDLAKAATAGGGFVNFTWAKPGKGDTPKLGYATMIPGTSYWIGTGVYVDNVDDTAAAIAGRMNAAVDNWTLIDGLVFAVMFLLVLLPLSFKISRSIVGPIKATTAAAARIARGDLDVRLQASGADEISQLQQALETMAAALKRNLDALTDKEAMAMREAQRSQQAAAEAQEAVRKVETAHAAILATVNGLTDVVAQLDTATRDLTAIGRDIQQGAQGQQERLEHTAEAMSQMRDAVGNVAANASDAASVTGLTREAASEGEAIIRQTVAAMGGLKTLADSLKTNMNQLGVQSEGIGAVIQVISDIADQTNLLALNAAIEAARAGDAGRGFAVVADEVRKLAEKTMAATGEVGQSIKAIQSMTRDNLAGVDKTMRAVDDTAGLAHASGEKLRQILGAAEQAAAQVRTIAAAADQQAASAQAIMRSVDEVSGIARNSAGHAADAARHIQKLSQQTGALTGLIRQLDKR
ncbi:methyl-accepting chemotaxis protein [Megalodesulfovibrio gigas]|uniref:Putative methyl-accepting chemotaxis protein n=1 Tax=Megalodesulfovibrio gigas (strain ATCC 19364 / DSM 1382 / NCIMB 9332 / VKM B-1759) TaxID=1121448 RepID=T2GAX7_MEGG1|nr:methyl-accepting chemotaxis protein [Megalodesulfovibrio gigas]AGW13334.1 putative methyl-accepting chemotaxis protein [Megalodesulfovibrio gigas DSM 1382 = ATCC 19364]